MANRPARCLTVASLLVLLVAARPVRAQDVDNPGPWWAAADLGASDLYRGISGYSVSQVRFQATASAGIKVRPRFLIGGEVGNWVLQTQNVDTWCDVVFDSVDCWDQGTGKGITTVFVTARIYPSKMSTFHIRLGGGLVNAWSNPDATSDWGHGVEAGAGYDVHLTGRLYLTPFVTFFSGRVGDLDLRGITAGAGITWR